MAEPAFDHERLDVYRLAIEQVAFPNRIARSFFVSIDKLGIKGCVRRNRFR